MGWPIVPVPTNPSCMTHPSPWNHATSTVCDTLERVMYLGVSTYGMRSCVIPAHAGIQVPPELDPGVRQDDVSSLHLCTWESV